MEFDHIIFNLVQSVLKDAITECKQESQISELREFKEEPNTEKHRSLPAAQETDVQIKQRVPDGEEHVLQYIITPTITTCHFYYQDQMNKSALLEESLLEEATSDDDLRKTKSENNSKELKTQMKMQKKKEKEMRKQNNKNHSLPFMHGWFKKLFKNKTKEQK